VVFNLGLIGYPLGHSLSPKIHRAALEACGLDGDYSLFPIHPEDHLRLKHMLSRIRSGEIHGLNVTIPHKQVVISLLDELTPTAEAIAAVNTIYLKNGKLTGDNTDAPGFMTDLQNFLTTETRRHPGPTNNAGAGRDTKSALIFGAGGSARAVVYALAKDCWKVTVASRRIEQAQTLITHLSNPDSHLSSIEFELTNLYSLVSNLTLLINTTPVGMSPEIDFSPWPVDLPFPQNVVVYDLVYNPRETKLVRDARAAGLAATTGLGMLIEQAALSFRIWTGCLPQRKALFKAVD
jgi:shikimate dehydrogenase